MSPVSSTGAVISSRHSRTAATAGSSSSLTNPPGRHQSPYPGSIDLRPRTIPPSASTTTAVDTFGSCHKMKLSLGQASTSRPSITRGTNSAPQFTQKCPTPRRRLGLRGGCVLLLFPLERRLHVSNPYLVAAALLG